MFKRRSSRVVLALSLTALAGVSLSLADGGKSGSGRAVSTSGVNARQPHDFSNAFYVANGINPAAIIGRPAGALPNSILDSRAPDANHNNVRLLQTSNTWDASGHPMFFTVSGLLSPSSFTPDLAGMRARQIANSYVLYDFPKAANVAFATFPKRQEAISDTRNGYFSNDPLGMWRIAHVRYNTAAFGTQDAQQRLADLAARNGTDADGTPLVKTMSELEDLRSRGLVTVTLFPTDGSRGFPWFICTVIQDPRNGAIAADAFEANALRADGTQNPGERVFSTTFNALQTTGDFPH